MKMARAGEPAGGDLVTQPPVKLVVSVLHRKANDSRVHCQELHRILLLLASLQAVQLHFLKQKQTSPLLKLQFLTVPGTVDLQMPATCCHGWKVHFPR